MAVQVKRFSFTTQTGSGNQAVTGLGFQPVGLLFLSARSTLADASVESALSQSWGATDGSNQWACSSHSDDAAATMNTGRVFRTSSPSGCIELLSDGTPTPIARASIVSLGADGFTISWSAAPGAAYYVEVLAFAGVSFKVGNTLVPTGGGAQSVTGVGFQPKLVLTGFSLANASDYAQPGGALGIGAASSLADQGAIGYFDRDNVTTSDSASIGGADRFVVGCTQTSTVLTAQLQSMDANGFSFTTPVPSAVSDRYFGWAAIGGADLVAKVVQDSQKTSTGTQAKTGVGFQPKALLAFSARRTDLTLDNSTNGDAGQAIGIADAPGQESNIQATMRDAAADSIVKRSHSRTKLVTFHNILDQSLVAAADLASFDADGYTLDWTTADANARPITVVAIGEAAVTAPSLRLVRAPVRLT